MAISSEAGGATSPGTTFSAVTLNGLALSMASQVPCAVSWVKTGSLLQVYSNAGWRASGPARKPGQRAQMPLD